MAEVVRTEHRLGLGLILTLTLTLALTLTLTLTAASTHRLHAAAALDGAERCRLAA